MVTFQRIFPLNVFNENYIAGEKIKNICQTELDFTLIMPKMDSPLNSAYEMIHGTKCKTSFS